MDTKQRLHAVILAIFYCYFLNISFGYSQEKPQTRLEEQVKQKEVQLIRSYKYVVTLYEKQLGYEIPRNVSWEMASLSLSLTDPIFESNFRRIKKIDDLKLYDKVENKTEPKIYSSEYIKSIYREGIDLIILKPKIEYFNNLKSQKSGKGIYAVNTIKNDSSVLEVGGGFQDAAAEIFGQNHGIEFYASEIDSNAFRFASEYYKGKPYLIEKENTFHAINSSEKSTKLEGKKFDYIISVSAFHHFRFPEEMLESIRKSCDSSAQIMVHEEFEPNFNPFVQVCKDVMEKKEVLALFKKHGFVLKEGKKTSSTTRYFRFELKN